MSQCSKKECGQCPKGCKSFGEISVAEQIILFVLTAGKSALPVTGPTSDLAIQELARGMRKLLGSPPLLDIMAKELGLKLHEVSGLAQRILRTADDEMNSRSK